MRIAIFASRGISLPNLNEKYGSGAQRVHAAQIIDAAEFVLAFWDGTRGTFRGCSDAVPTRARRSASCARTARGLGDAPRLSPLRSEKLFATVPDSRAAAVEIFSVSSKIALFQCVNLFVCNSDKSKSFLEPPRNY